MIEYLQGNQSQAATLLCGGIRHPPDERKEGDTMITYSDLIQFCIFIVALVGFCYEMFKGKRKWPPLLRIMTAVAINSFNL